VYVQSAQPRPFEREPVRLNTTPSFQKQPRPFEHNPVQSVTEYYIRPSLVLYTIPYVPDFELVCLSGRGFRG
jgi:hypothetical protein